jgi:hypothetical protein
MQKRKELKVGCRCRVRGKATLDSMVLLRLPVPSDTAGSPEPRNSLDDLCLVEYRVRQWIAPELLERVDDDEQ